MAIENKKKTLHLLILEDSQNEAERLVSLFRNGGHATRVHRITSVDDLTEVLSQSWDLLIAAPHSQNLAPAEALATVHRLGNDLPFIQLVAGETVEEVSDAITMAMDLGAEDALPVDADEHLLLAANRELHNLAERRARRAAEVALREAEKRCQLLLQSSVDAIAYVHDGMHIYVNQAYVDLFAYTDADDIAGMPMIDLIKGSDQSQVKDFLKNYSLGDGHAELTCDGVREDGSQFRARMVFSPATYDGEPCIQVVIRAEQDNAELEEKLREISSQDLVTGLFNRSHFLELLDHAAERAVHSRKPTTLALMRIDRYAALLGEIGVADIDLLLADCAGLLRKHFGDKAQLARFSDDTFAVMLADTLPEASADSLKKLLKEIEGHLFGIAKRTVQITMSIGVAGLNERDNKVDVVMERAHRCLEKLTDGNAVKIYDPTEELAAAASRGDMLALVRHALETNGFMLMFQPTISLHGDKRENYEVFARLNNAEGEAVPPAEFLAAAQEAGVAVRLDRWMLLNAVRQLAEHRNAGHDTRLFVNLSAASLQDPALLQWLNTALKAARLPGNSLVLQFAESDVVTYLKQAKLLTQGLAQLHCGVSMSKFGCTLNPFNTLRHLHVDFIRIDTSFLNEIDEEEPFENLKTMITTLHGQAKLTIMPNVDNPSMLTKLWQTGVNYVQGQYLQGPGPRMNYEFSTEE